MKTKLFFLAFLTSLLSWGQATLPVSTDALSASSLPTGFTSIGLGANYTTPCSAALRLDGAGDSVRLFFSGTPGTLTYQLKANVGSGSWQGVFTIEESVDGVTWTTLRSITATGAISTAAGTTFTDSPLATTRYIRWTYTTKTNGNIGMCNVDLSAVTTSTPTLTVSATSVTAMDYVFGNGPSTPAKTFTVAGSNLAPLDAADRYVYIEPTGSDFEFSLDNSTFYTAGEIIPFPTGDGFAATTVYVRLKAGLPVGTYTDNTTITYYNAPTPDLVENISLSGEVTAVAATISTGTITGSPFCVTASTGASVSVPFTSTGTFNAGNVYTAQLSNNAGSFASPVNIGTVTSVANSGTITATIPANTATGTGYRIRVVASNPTTTGANNGTNLTINLASNSIAPTAPQTIPIGVNGNTLTVTETSTPISRVWKYGTTIGSYTTTTASTGTTFVPNFTSANTYYVVCESTFACGTITSNYVTINVNTPEITITGTPTSFTYAEGQGPSAYQTLNVSGTSLTDNITITVPNANWEISTSTTFSAPSATITLNKIVTTHVVASTSVYVRLKAGLSQGQYEFPTDTDFVATSTNAITKTADLDGEVTAPKAELELRGVFTDLTESNIIVNGDTTPYTLDNTEFASQFINIAQTKTFRIRNIGGLTLNVSSITLDNTADFSITASTPFVIAGATYTDFTITFQPQSMGDRTAIVTIVSSDLTDSPYTFTIKGLGKNAEIAVTGNSINIPNGNTAISATDNTFIGDANGNPANPSTVSQNFVISNSGNVALTISGITISGADASQFSVSPTTTSIAAGATGIITVTFAPTSIGIKNATINIANNDLTDSENPNTFAVQGNAVSYVTCASGLPTIVYETGFEVSEGFATVQTYTNDIPWDKGPTSAIWKVTRGNTSTTQAIDTQSVNLRLYTSPASYPSAYTDFELDNVAKVTFRARTPDAVTVTVSYSIDGGSTYINPANYSLTAVTTGVPTYTYTLSSSVEIDNVKIKFEIPITVSRPSSSSKQLIIDDIKVYGLDTPAEKTWNGTAWSGDGLPPTASQKAIIDGDLTLPYTLALNGTTYDVLEACECQVNAGRTLTAGNIAGTTPATLNIQGLLANSGIVKINNNSSLVQHNNDVTNTNAAGAVFNYERKATVKRYDYVYWSSPTIDFNMSGIVSHSRYYWDAQDPNANGSQGDWLPASGNMENGRGYIFRVPNSYATTSSPDNLTANFTGVPFNGIKNMEVKRGDLASATDSDWNLIGNPYPSAIDVVSTAGFLDYNTNLEGFVYVWTHGNSPFDAAYPNPFYQNYTYNYNPNDYTQINRTGNSVAPGDIKIAAGQGFFVQMKPGPPTTAPHETVTFKNSFRSKNHANNQFYRMANNAVSDDERNRLWLDLNSTQTSTRILVGYVDGATNAFDRMYDASTEVKTAEQNFYSTLNNEIFKIQGKALPFNENDVVPLGVNITATGMHNIALANADGLFTGNQNIYLEDTQLGIIHDLRVNPYNFTAPLGVNNSRFILRYTNGTLNQDEIAEVSNSVFVVSNESLTISSLKESIKAIEIYDLLGRKLYQDQNVNSLSQTISSIQKTNSGLIIYITLESGKQVVKKAIY